MEELKKFLQLPLKHKIVTVVILIVIAIATAFSTTACSFKATDLQFDANPTNYSQGVNDNEQNR